MQLVRAGKCDGRIVLGLLPEESVKVAMEDLETPAEKLAAAKPGLNAA